MLKTTRYSFLYFLIILLSVSLHANECETKVKSGPIDFELNVSPNPATNTVSITFTEPLSTDILIHDNLGNIVYDMPVINVRKIEVALLNLNAGIYFVSVKTKGKTLIKRLIKI